MRSDMAKIIVERPRVGGDSSFPLRSQPDSHRLDMEDWQRRQSIRRPWMHDRKSLNENLAPLRRYLRSQVGRPWDKVYSEICQHMNRDSAVQLHIWQHLMRYVCVDKDYEGCDRGSLASAEFLVHPRTGLLCVNRFRRVWRRSEPKRNPDIAPGEGDIHYQRIDGVWYEVRTADLPAAGAVYDFVLRKYVQREKQAYGRRESYAVAKRQLNSKEIRRLGLAAGGTAGN
jgi:hypothetical protein